MFIFSRSKWLVFISPKAPPHPPRGLSPACACCWQLQPSPEVFLGCTRGQVMCSPLWDWSGCLYLYAGIPGLAIMMDSRWKRPSPKYLRRGKESCDTGKQQHPIYVCTGFPNCSTGEMPGIQAPVQGQQAQQELPGMAGLERQPCSEQGGVLTPAQGGWELLHLNGWF